MEPRDVACEGICTERVLADLRGRQTCAQGCHQVACECTAEGRVSYAMTVMDKICGRREYQQWMGSLFAACMWIYTKAVLCVEHDSIHTGIHEKG